MEYREPRVATVSDIDALVLQRAEMFAGMGKLSDGQFDAMLAQSTGWFRRHVGDGSYIGFLISAADEAKPVAGGGVLILDWPPMPGDSETLRGYVLNVFVDPAHRRRGLARAVTAACIEACRVRGIRTVALHAADEARAIYEQFGFVPTNEMRLDLE